MEDQTKCKRCGSCCINGGPALHHEDLALFKTGVIIPAQCITIRKGEMVTTPGQDVPESTQQELIKIKGKGSEWRCLFFQNADKSCAIYENRPFECRIFECWEPTDLQEIIGENTLTRKDLLPPNDPFLEFIDLLEKECPVEQIQTLTALPAENKSSTAALNELEILANKDMAIRTKAVKQLSLNRDLELFLLGRPYFLLLAPHGITARETKKGISLSLDKQ